MNVQKFFNKKLRNPKSAYSLGKLFSKTKPYSPRIGRRIKETPTLKKLLSIHKKVKSIENLLGGIGKLDTKIIGVQDKAEKDKKKEKKKEGKKSNKLFGGIIQRPKTGFLDAIRNFVTYTFLGWLFTFLQPHLDKMQFILPVIQTAFDVMIFILKNILGGIGNTLKAFYFVKDNLTGVVDKVKEAASGIQKTFDNTLVALQDVVNGTIEVVNSFIESTGEKFDKVETVDAGTIPPLPEVPKFDNSAPTQQPNTLPPGIPMQGAATGGRIDPSTPVTRGIQPEQRRDFRPLFKPSIQEQKSEPGKDVGGIDKVKDLYKSSTSGSGFSLGFFTISPTNEKDGFLALNKVSRELKINKSDDFLGLGNFMGASVDVALGQKPDKRTYQQFASGINYLVNYGINNPEAFQKMNLEKMIETMVNSKVDVAINKIREEINKRSTTETPGDGESAPPGDGLPSGAPSVESIDMSGISPEDVDALGRMISAEAKNQSPEGKAAVMNVILNRYRLARAGKGYLPRGKTKDNVTIRDLLYAPSQFSPITDGSFDRTSSAAGKSALAMAISAGGNDPEKLKRTLMEKYKLSEADANYVITSTAFSNPQTRGRVPFRTREVRVGDHAFQESPFARLSRPGEKIETQIREAQYTGNFSKDYLNNLQSVLPGLTLEGQRYRASRDGGSREHAGRDYDLPTNGVFYSRMGGVVIFAGNAGGGYGNVVDIYNKDLNRTERIAEGTTILQGIRVGATVAPGQPVVRGTHQTGVIHYEIRQGRAGSSGSVRGTEDPDRFLASNEYRSYIEKIREQSTISKEKETTPSPSQQLTIQQKQDIHSKLTTKGQIPFKVGNESFYFVALADGSYRAYRNRNILGANVPEPIDISGSNNRPIQAAIRQTINKMYPLPSLSQPPKKKKGGLVYEQNNNPLFPPQTYASYNEPQMMAKVFIQPVIIEAPKSSTPSGIMFPSINLNSSKSPKLIKQ